MRPLLTLIFALSFSTVQAALNTESLPAGSVAIIGIDITAFRASKVGRALEKLADLKAKDLEASRRLREQLGIDSKNDLHEVVVAIYPGADGKVAEKNASGVVLIRGKFLPAQINTFGQSNNLPSKTVGKHQAWEALIAAIYKVYGDYVLEWQRRAQASRQFPQAFVNNFGFLVPLHVWLRLVMDRNFGWPVSQRGTYRSERWFLGYLPIDLLI